MFASWLPNLNRASQAQAAAHRRGLPGKRGAALSLALERLEDRTVPSGCGVGYQLDIETFYQFGGSGIGGIADPDTGFFRVTNDGSSTFNGTIREFGVSGFGVAGHIVVDSSFVGTLAPGASVLFALGPGTGLLTDSSNYGGFNKVTGQPDNGIQITLIGTVSAGGNSESVNLLVFDKDIHSGTFRTNPFGAVEDNYVLQGGDPFGRDTGDGFEVTQPHGHFGFFEAATQPPLVTAPENQTATEGASRSFNLGSFSDLPGGPWTVDVNWGDNTAHTSLTATTPGSLGTQSHTYTEEGTYTVTVTVTNTANPPGCNSGSNTFQAGVADAPLHAACASISPIAGAPFNGVVASFTDDNPGGALSDYRATITWGNGNTSTGIITPNGSGGFNVSGSNTYAAAGPYTLSVLITDVGGSMATASCSTTVANLGIGVQPGQTATIGFWHNQNGQALINSFNGGPNATALANWLAATFPNLYGPNAGANNLTGQSNAQVAAFYETLFAEHGPKLDAQVLDTALDVYATTLSLGGTVAAQYGFTVTAFGLGASSFNVGSSGAAFAVPDNTTLNVYQILKAVNQRAVKGVLYNGDMSLRDLAIVVFDSINQAGDIG